MITRRLVQYLLAFSFLMCFVFACHNDEFTCTSGECISLSFHCDGSSDCIDGSDEHHCPDVNCSAGEFQCHNNKQCILTKWKCDGDPDCHDGSDEWNCGDEPCSDQQFPCTGNGSITCIPLGWECDGHKDCPSGSDEEPAMCEERRRLHALSCGPNEFTCKNGSVNCISARFYCDGDKDCADGSDENDCPERSCDSKTQFSCGDGYCIPLRWKCDGDPDCRFGVDELGCGPNGTARNHSCPAGKFACQSSQCVPSEWRCDGEFDCFDRTDEDRSICGKDCPKGWHRCAGTQRLTCVERHRVCDRVADCPGASDEQHCPHASALCREGQFNCSLAAADCVAQARVCDGVKDCGSGADEDPLLCSVVDPCAIDNGGCAHVCTFVRPKRVCSCRRGFQLADDGVTCNDIDECALIGPDRVCTQDCQNLHGSYKCTCLPGYAFDVLERRCRAGETLPSIVFANRHDVRQIDLRSGTYRSIVSDLKSAIALDYDHRARKIFWTDVSLEQILVADLVEGGAAQPQHRVLVSESISTPDGLAYDWVHGNLYWTDTGHNRISLINVKSGRRATVVEGHMDEPRAIVVDPREGHGWIYWTDWGDSARIERAGLDGSNRQTLLTANLNWPNGLTIDYSGDRLYWVDAKRHEIGSCDLDGGQQRVILNDPVSVKRPFAISVFEDFVYWTDWEQESIYRARKQNGADLLKVAGELYAPMDLHVYHPLKQPQAPSQCGDANNGCSYLCLPGPRGRPSCHGPPAYRLITPTHAPNQDDPVAATSLPVGGARGSGSQLLVPLAACLGLLVVLVAVALVLVMRVRRRRRLSGQKQMNFDNPVYHKTTVDIERLFGDQSEEALAAAGERSPMHSGGLSSVV